MDFLKLNVRDIQANAGTISTRLGEEIAHREFEKYWEHQKQIERENPIGALESSVQKVTGQWRKKKP